MKVIFKHTQARKLKRPRGRPRKRGVRPYSHYAGSFEGERPKCKAPGCRNWLKADQHATCSKGCHKKLGVKLRKLIEAWNEDEKAHAAGDAQDVI